MIVYSFINLKGGVGKTTLSINTAVELANQNAKILFIDNDEQSNSSLFFNVSDKEKTLATMFEQPDVDIHDIIYKTNYGNIDCIPAGHNLNTALIPYLFKDTFRGRDKTRILKDKLDKLADDYEICIIDNHPGVNVATYNALMATNCVVIVTTQDTFSREGMLSMKDIVDSIKSDRIKFDPEYDENDIRKSIRIEGCIINKYVYNSHFTKDKKEQYFQTNIRMVPRDKIYLFNVAIRQKKAFIELAPRSNFRQDIKKFANELIDKILD